MGKHGQYRALVALAAALSAAPGPAGAACRLALALGFDVSFSVDAEDYAIQKQGLIAALRDPGIRRAFLRPADRVRLAVYEWSGPEAQETVVPWTEVAGEADLDGVIASLAAHERAKGHFPTAMGEALDYGRDLLDDEPACSARTLDISGDGRSNTGIGPRRVYADRDWEGVTVNGLAIGGTESDIVVYYRQEVIRGRGAFVEPAANFTAFPEAIRRKLEKELSEAVIGGAPRAPPGAGAGGPAG